MNDFQMIYEETIKKHIEEHSKNSSEKEHQNFIKELEDENPLIVDDIIKNTSKALKKVFLKDSKTMLNNRHKEILGFNSRNYKRWEKAFNLLEIIIVLSIEIGEDIYENNQNDNLSFDLIMRHQARACQIAQEILCLLKNGFPDGAHARWRTLHETSVTALFIDKHGEDLAKQFNDYNEIEIYQSMKKEHDFKDRTQTKVTDYELEKQKIIYDDILKKYEKYFIKSYKYCAKKSYAWAVNFLNGKRLNFAEIEKDVGLDHWRAYFKYASHNIHSSAPGITYKLGLSESVNDILLSGQSNSGMTLPTDSTAIALTQITTLILTINPTIDNEALILVLKELQEELAVELIKSENKTSN